MRRPAVARVLLALFPAPAGVLPPCTQTIATLKGTQTIDGSSVPGPNINVICVTDIDLRSGQVVTLIGDPGDTFVFVITGNNLRLSGGADIRAVGNITPADVLYNIIGTGGEFRADVGSIVDGSLLALDRDINLKGGFVNGQVFSRRAITIISGAAVRCPTP